MVESSSLKDCTWHDYPVWTSGTPTAEVVVGVIAISYVMLTFELTPGTPSVAPSLRNIDT